MLNIDRMRIWKILMLNIECRIWKVHYIVDTEYGTYTVYIKYRRHKHEYGTHRFRVWKVLMQSMEGTGILYFYMPIRKVYGRYIVAE
jgi:hypothetical protein